MTITILCNLIANEYPLNHRVDMQHKRKVHTGLTFLIVHFIELQSSYTSLVLMPSSVESINHKLYAVGIAHAHPIALVYIF